jgi:hypothetical protein
VNLADAALRISSSFMADWVEWLSTMKRKLAIAAVLRRFLLESLG